MSAAIVGKSLPAAAGGAPEAADGLPAGQPDLEFVVAGVSTLNVMDFVL